MDMYGIGAMSSRLSAMQTQYQAAVSVMKMSMEATEMVMDTLVDEMQGMEAGMSGLGRLVDITV